MPVDPVLQAAEPIVAQLQKDLYDTHIARCRTCPVLSCPALHASSAVDRAVARRTQRARADEGAGRGAPTRHAAGLSCRCRGPRCVQRDPTLAQARNNRELAAQYKALRAAVRALFVDDRAAASHARGA